MTVIQLGAIRRYSGLSSDTKPTSRVPDGATFYETDSGRTFTFDGLAWWPLPDAVTNAEMELLLQEQLVLLRGIRFGLSELTGVDLSEIT